MALSPDVLNENFEKTQKCKIEGIVTKIIKLNNENCSVKNLIYVTNKEITYSVKGIFPNDGCIIDSFYKTFFNNEIKIGENINLYLDKNNYYPLDFNPKITKTLNIPYCTGNIITQEAKKIPQNNSNYYLFGSLILAFIIIGVLVFKLLKIEK